MSPRSRAMQRQEAEREPGIMDKERAHSVLPLDLRTRKNSKDMDAGERMEHSPTRPQHYSVCQGTPLGIKGSENELKPLSSISLPAHVPLPTPPPLPGAHMIPNIQHLPSGVPPKIVVCWPRSSEGAIPNYLQPSFSEGAPQNCPQPHVTGGAPQICPQPSVAGAPQNYPQPPVTGAPWNSHQSPVTMNLQCLLEAKSEPKPDRETAYDSNLHKQGVQDPQRDSAWEFLRGPVSERQPDGKEPEGPAGLQKPQASLPLRKRRHTVQDSERSPQSTGKVPKTEGCKEAACEKAKGPQHGSTEGLLNLSDGCPHPTAYYSPYVTVTFPHLPHYYPGVSGSCFPPNLPLYPTTSYPLLPGSILGVHGPTCHFLYSLDNQLATDISMASKQDEDGDTALHIAVAQGNVNMVHRLIYLFLQGKKELDTYNIMRQTPIHLAVITKQPALVALLMSHGASPMTLDRNGQTCIHLACEHGSVACLQALTESSQGNVDLETRNYEGFTPLHVAVNTSNTDAVLFLLEHGADIDAVDIKSGRSPLIHAVENNSMNLVMLLLQNGANVNSQTYSGNTALHSASGRGLLDIVRVLMKNGADCSIKNYHNDTSLMVAKNKKVIDALRGKTSQPLSHQNSASKFSVENGGETLFSQGNSSNSPGTRLTPNATDLIGQTPSSNPQHSPVGPFLALPSVSSSSLPPHSASNHSCNSRSSQDHRSSPTTNSGKMEQWEPAENACAVKTSVTYPSPVKSEGNLYRSVTPTSASQITCSVLGQPQNLSRTSRVFLPFRDVTMDPRAPSPSSLYPFTALGGTLLQSQLECPPSHIALASLTLPQPSFPLSTDSTAHRISASGTFTTWSSDQRINTHGEPCSKDSEQSQASAINRIKDER
uniref:Uncharacterized protein LOC117345795 n=1 Tax=Geotrypetes seraphini TaxID=260995 RepID=A0A6P8P751_GEOSA|nr:uncharacterized protein LOC117345795 [Geotrypetes seraphini]